MILLKITNKINNYVIIKLFNSNFDALLNSFYGFKSESFKLTFQLIIKCENSLNVHKS